MVRQPQAAGASTVASLKDERVAAGQLGVEATVATVEQSFDLAPHELFEILTTPDTYPHWLVGAKRIRWVAPSWPGVGSHFQHVVGLGALKISDRTSVTAIEKPRLLELLVRARPLLRLPACGSTWKPSRPCVLRMTETPIGAYKLASMVLQPLIRARNAGSMHRLSKLVDAHRVMPSELAHRPEGQLD